MEKAVTAAIIRLEAVAKIVPVPDSVDCLVTDNLLENVRGRRPVDGPQHKKSPIEPGGKEVNEVGVDGLEFLIVLEIAEQMLSHPDQRGRSAGRQIETPYQLLPARFGGGV